MAEDNKSGFIETLVPSPEEPEGDNTISQRPLLNDIGGDFASQEQKMRHDLEVAEVVFSRLATLSEQLPYHNEGHTHLVRQTGRAVVTALNSSVPLPVMTPQEELILDLCAGGHDMVQMHAPVSNNVSVDTQLQRFRGLDPWEGNEGATISLLSEIVTPLEPRQEWVPEENLKKMLLASLHTEEQNYMEVVSAIREAKANITGSFLPYLNQISDAIIATEPGYVFKKEGSFFYHKNIKEDTSLVAVLLAMSDTMGACGTLEPTDYVQSSMREFREIHIGYERAFGRKTKEEVENLPIEIKTRAISDVLTWLSNDHYFTRSQQFLLESYLGEAELIDKNSPLFATASLFRGEGGVAVPSVKALTSLPPECITALRDVFSKFEENAKFITDLGENITRAYAGVESKDFLAMSPVEKDAAVSKHLAENNDIKFWALMQKFGYDIRE